MELKVGMRFTGSEQCFTGRVEILEIDEPNNRLRVGLTKKNETFTSNWNEDWDLQPTIWGFERGDYFVKNYTNYPQDLQRSTEQQCNIADVSKRRELLLAFSKFAMSNNYTDIALNNIVNQFIEESK